MSKHTPGPWHLAPMNGMGGCREIRGPHRKEGLAGTVGLRDDDEDAANAALITAAPELLELAHAFVSYLEDNSKSERRRAACLEEARALVAKAEGRS